ncbi:MAG TPA: biotin--[acetyl-CoA-carboxylase] ligase [Acidimicrobiales bacterium]|jgi:BirA family biotin operon repressor/biotin-[acetyl-CoA-carboxylase] ligase|nr:biotin--[acetyl-CoA-carboxylase] ligase [Acidimicrobiales bacterium]
MWGGIWDVRWFEEIDSTNTYLRSEAQHGAPEGVVAVADHQRAGRGRLDRRWEAPPGASLLASVLFRPDFDPAELHLCTAAVALAAAAACREVAGIGPVLKWPNDLLVGESKLAGVLAEADFSGARCSVVVGIGINVAWPGPEGVGGTCLNDVAAEPVDRKLLLDALLSALSPRRALLDSAAGRREVAAELRERCATLGQRVRVELASEAVIGTATEVDDAGHLVVQTAEGPRTVAAGDVVHLRPH